MPKSAIGTSNNLIRKLKIAEFYIFKLRRNIFDLFYEFSFPNKKYFDTGPEKDQTGIYGCRRKFW